VTSPSPARQATSLFRARFGSRPALLASAPGRLNLLGEHTDYNGGPVLPCAIERRTAVAAGPAPGWAAVSALDGTLHALDPEAPGREHWTDYLTGVVRVLRQERLAPPGARLAVASTVPPGAGLASSAALCVAAAGALLALAGRRVAPRAVADLAYRAEHDEVGVRCGRMDQIIAALARPGSALLFETGGGRLDHVPLPGPLWVFETGVAHRLRAGEYNRRRSECETARLMLAERGFPVRHLADLRPDQLPRLEQALPPPWIRRVRHVILETARTRAAARALALRKLPELGRLLFEGHASLRDDYQSSCAEADLLVEAAARHGALGARLTGAGWGGAVIALLPEARALSIAAAMAGEFQARYGRAVAVWCSRAARGLEVRRVRDSAR
jgi:galactokinase